MIENITLQGYSTGIIRKTTEDWKIYPPREVMRSAGLLPDTEYITIKLDNGGIALIPIKKGQ